MNTIDLIIGILIGLLAGSIITWLAASLSRFRADRGIRKDAADRSRHVIKGKMAEQMAPLLPGFRYSPADARFLGDPIDYIVFNGYGEVKDDHSSPGKLEIILLDIKSGKAQLSKSQRAIRDAVRAGRVRFETARVDADGHVLFS